MAQDRGKEMDLKNQNFLVGKEAIAAYCGVSVQRLQLWLCGGKRSTEKADPPSFPARKIGRTYMAYRPRVDRWLDLLIMSGDTSWRD